jgi:hypothetical protein
MILQAYSLDGVSDSLKKAYKLFTDGKFSNALQAFNQMLWTIPLVVVSSRKEVDEVKELLTICRSAAHTNKHIPTSTIALCSPTAFQMLSVAMYYYPLAAPARLNTPGSSSVLALLL